MNRELLRSETAFLLWRDRHTSLAAYHNLRERPLARPESYPVLVVWCTEYDAHFSPARSYLWAGYVYPREFEAA